MFVLVLSLLLFCSLFYPPAFSVQYEFVKRGKGRCCKQTSCSDAENTFEYTLVKGENKFFYEYDCDAWCLDQGDCLGYLYAVTILGGFTSKCFLFADDGKGDFTSVSNITSNSNTQTYKPDGEAVLSEGAEFKTGSGVNPDEFCYQKMAIGGGAVGDPHITSIYGCGREADRYLSGGDGREIELMGCDGEEEQLRVTYKRSLGFRISRVDIVRKGKREKFAWKTLKHGQTSVVCGNTIEFHRYAAGINVRVKHIGNRNITGMFADKSCLSN